jgi:predicted ATPase with chaperone activity
MGAMASDLFANASLFTPAEPQSLKDLDINETIIAGLIMRLMYMNSKMVAHEIAAELCLPFYNVVEPVINDLKESRLLEITRGDMASVSYVYSITDAGRTRALQYFEQTTYVGPAPVSVETYVQIIAEQSLRQITVHADRLREAFRGLVFDESILDQIGPAVNSGRSIFLYGPPGNGKTSICERIVKSFGGSIFIPFAVEVKGAIIKVFDEYNHKEIAPKDDMRLQGK